MRKVKKDKNLVPIRRVIIQIECECNSSIDLIRRSTEVSMWGLEGEATLCAMLTEAPRVNVIRAKAGTVEVNGARTKKKGRKA